MLNYIFVKVLFMALAAGMPEDELRLILRHKLYYILIP